MRLGENPSVLLECLHLEALGVRVLAAGFACYSWWLPPPRWLGAARIVERRLVIVFGSDRGYWEGYCAFPDGAPKDNSSGLLISLSYLTYG